MITMLTAQPRAASFRAPVHMSPVPMPAATWYGTSHAAIPATTRWLGGDVRGLGNCTTTGFGTKRITPGSLGGST